jgi:hypothetical protein
MNIVPDIQRLLTTRCSVAQIMVDFRLCRWPEEVKGTRDTSVAEYFDNLNEPELSQLADTRDANGASEPLITFSHFLPLQVHSPVTLL